MNDNLMPDQRLVWDKKHAEGDHDKLLYSPSPLAILAEPYFRTDSKILELGCGVGRDAIFFQERGHSVLATDSSSVVIKKNMARIHKENVVFEVLDMQEPLSYADESFDVVFANLSLHYYLDKKTREIAKEITRVIKPGGVLAFACKSHDEFRTNEATKLEDNVFVAPNGHALHIFSEDYAKDLLGTDFEIKHLDELDEEYLGRISGIVRCIARKLV